MFDNSFLSSDYYIYMYSYSTGVFKLGSREPPEDSKGVPRRFEYNYIYKRLYFLFSSSFFLHSYFSVFLLYSEFFFITPKLYYSYLYITHWGL